MESDKDVKLPSYKFPSNVLGKIKRLEKEKGEIHKKLYGGWFGGKGITDRKVQELQLKRDEIEKELKGYWKKCMKKYKVNK